MPKQQPTNLDILNELKIMSARITNLEQWKIAEDAAKKAVTDYRNREYQEQVQQSWLEILKQFSPFLVAISALVYAILQGMRK